MAGSRVVLGPVHHVRLHTSTFQHPGGKANRRQHARAFTEISPLAHAHRNPRAAGEEMNTWHSPTATPPSLTPTCEVGRKRGIRTQGTFPACCRAATYALAEHDKASISRTTPRMGKNAKAKHPPRCPQCPRSRGSGSQCHRSCCSRLRPALDQTRTGSMRRVSPGASVCRAARAASRAAHRRHGPGRRPAARRRAGARGGGKSRWHSRGS